MPINEILKEIYMIDPELEKHGADLEKVVLELIKQKPELAIDQAFVKSLRVKIMPEEKIQSEVPVAKKASAFSFQSLLFMGAGAAVMLLVALPFMEIDFGSKLVQKTAEVAPQNKITKVAANAYGALDTAAPVADGRGGGGGNVGAQAANYAANADTKVAAAPEPKMLSRTIGTEAGSSVLADETAAVEEAAPAVDEKMIVPPMIPSYTYKYMGNDLAIESGQADVYKRVKGASFDFALSSIADNIKGLPFSTAMFKDTVLQNFSIAENRDFGYQVNVNVTEGMIDIYQNWEQWQKHMPVCNDDKCWKENQMKMENMPSDAEIIAIANKFLEDYGINLSAYGQPTINAYWRTEFERATDKSTVWIPEDVQVVFPTVIDGQQVYDGSGYASGVSVNVNVKFNKVSGFYSLRSDNFESSAYDLETDKDRIIKAVERGGQYPIYYAGFAENGQVANDSEQVVELGTPEKVLMNYWKYDEKNGQSYELFVPALKFPVTKVPENAMYFNQQAIVVPLVKDILDAIDKNFEQPIYGDVMPMVKDVVPAADTVTSEETESAGNDTEAGAANDAAIMPMAR